MKKFLGYCVVNSKTENFVDYDGSECPSSFESWETPDGAQEVLDEIDFYISNHNNKHSRKVAQMRSYMKIGKVFVEA